MPFQKNSDVPKQENTKTAHQKEVFRKAFNNALEQGKGEGYAFRVANEAATKAGKKDKKS